MYAARFNQWMSTKWQTVGVFDSDSAAVFFGAAYLKANAHVYRAGEVRDLLNEKLHWSDEVLLKPDPPPPVSVAPAGNDILISTPKTTRGCPHD